MNYVMRQVKPKTSKETFLSALYPQPAEGLEVNTLVFRLLNCREEKVFRTWRNFTIFTKPEAMSDVVDILKEKAKNGYAIFGEAHGNHFAAVPYSKDRLVKNLLQSAHAFRLIRSGIRLIDNEHDLTNQMHRPVYRARAYKDDE